MTITPEQIQLLIVWYIVFIFSMVCHECAHALIGMRLGDKTAFLEGQVSLNPWPHMRREKFGTIIVPLVSFFMTGWMYGWGSAPYDPYWAARYPKRAAYMGLAGPAANFILLILAGILIHVGIQTGHFFQPESISYTTVVQSVSGGWPEVLSVFLSILFVLNLILFLFNLLPVPPLDGRMIPVFFLDNRRLNTYFDFMHHPGYGFFGILIAWHLFPVIFHPLYTVFLNILYPGSQYH